MTMIERVARALCIAAGVEPDYEWQTNKFEWQRYRLDAEAAILAMREPTDAMIAVTGDLSRDIIQTYTDMIDAALKE